MFYTANSLSFSFAFRHARSRFHVSRVSLDGLRKERLRVVCRDLLMFPPVALLHHSIYKPHPTHNPSISYEERLALEMLAW